MSSITTSSSSIDHIEIIKKRLCKQLLGNLKTDQSLKMSHPIIESMNTTDPQKCGSWPDIDYHDTSRTHWQPAKHLIRLATMSRTYALTGSFNELLQINLGLEYFLNSAEGTCQNWWYNYIYTPRIIGDILILITSNCNFKEELLPSLQAAVKVCTNVNLKTINYTGANLMDSISNLIKAACVMKSKDLMLACTSKIFSEIKVEEHLNREGIQVDDSFHQHGSQQAILSYGLVHSNLLTSFAELFQETMYQFSSDHLICLSKLLLGCQQWFVFKSQIDFHACGRGAFRGKNDAHCFSAYRQLGKIVRRMALIDKNRSTEYTNFFNRLGGGASLGETPSGKTSSGETKNGKNGKSENLYGTKYFYRSDTLCHRSLNGWYFSCRYHSSRCLPTECDTNRENIQGYHLADGCYFIMQFGDEYHNIQPLWDYRRLPGLTCLDVHSSYPLPAKNPKIGRSNTYFVGASTDGILCASAMEYKKAGIKMKKAHFVLDGETGVVCLGTGIELDAQTRTNAVVPSSSKITKVRTSLCQRRLVPSSERNLSPRTSSNKRDQSGGSVMVLKTFTSSGKRGMKTLLLGGKEYHCEASYHDGVAYVLLNDQSFSSPEQSLSPFDGSCNGDGLTVEVKEQFGSWRLVQDVASECKLSQNVFSTWINHGNIDSSDSCYRYAYRIIPGIVQDENGNWVVSGSDSCSNGEKTRTNTTNTTTTAPTTTTTSTGTTLKDFLESASTNGKCIVLSNTAKLQAIKVQNSTLAIFYSSDVTLHGCHFNNSWIKTNCPCALTIRSIDNNSNNIIMSVADPAQNKSSICITFDGLFTGVVSDKKLVDIKNTVVVDEALKNEKNTTQFLILLPQGIHAGKSVIIQIQKA